MGDIQKYLPRCLNCGTELKATDQFCPQCGQRTRGARVPLKDFIGDFLQDYFAVDSKFFKSILLLMARPGKLTKQFNEGRRKSYIAPLRMYLFTSFIYFFLLSLSVDQDSENFGFMNQNDDTQKAEILDSLLALESDTILISDLRALRDSGQFKAQSEGFITIEEEGLEEGEFEKGGFEEYLQSQAIKASKDPKSFVRSGFRVASVSLFFLLPIFALVLWAFHFRRVTFYVQHLVHALHLHTFGFALLSIYLFISFWFDAEISIYVSLILLVYFIWSLKVVYSQRLLPSIVKSISIIILYFFIVLIALVPALFVAIATV